MKISIPSGVKAHLTSIYEMAVVRDDVRTFMRLTDLELFHGQSDLNDVEKGDPQNVRVGERLENSCQ